MTLKAIAHIFVSSAAIGLFCSTLAYADSTTIMLNACPRVATRCKAALDLSKNQLINSFKTVKTHTVNISIPIYRFAQNHPYQCAGLAGITLLSATGIGIAWWRRHINKVRSRMPSAEQEQEKEIIATKATDRPAPIVEPVLTDTLTTQQVSSLNMPIEPAATHTYATDNDTAIPEPNTEATKTKKQKKSTRTIKSQRTKAVLVQQPATAIKSVPAHEQQEQKTVSNTQLTEVQEACIRLTMNIHQCIEIIQKQLAHTALPEYPVIIKKVYPDNPQFTLFVGRLDTRYPLKEKSTAQQLAHDLHIYAQAIVNNYSSAHAQYIKNRLYILAKQKIHVTNLLNEYAIFLVQAQRTDNRSLSERFLEKKLKPLSARGINCMHLYEMLNTDNSDKSIFYTGNRKNITAQQVHVAATSHQPYDEKWALIDALIGNNTGKDLYDAWLTDQENHTHTEMHQGALFLLACA